MHSSTLQGKIKLLETRQSILETHLKDHRQDINELKNQINTTTELPSTTAHDQPTTDPFQKTPPTPKNQTTKPNSTITKPKTKSTPISSTKTKPKPKRDLIKLEQDLGRIWFVRLGIISLLTGLIFLSNFTYQNYISEWGAGARLSGMYLLASLLLGLGTYFEKAKTALANYGKVLAAGGLATLYYTSYAASHVDKLKVIDSPLLGGLILTASAAACLTYAIWKRSNITAICSIGLAFYSTSINPIGTFSLISGLILTLTGLTLLHKLRSISIGFVSMLGAYLSFIFWQLFINHGTNPHSHTSLYIISYWLLSTAAILIPRAKNANLFTRTQLLTFASLNNAFLILLTSINYQTLNWLDPLWKISAIIGPSFIAISLLLQFGHKINTHISNIPYRHALRALFLLKGSALITLSLCLKLTGPSLALSLAIQATLILIAACRAEQTKKTALTILSHLTLTLSFAFFINNNQYHTKDLTISHLIMALLYTAFSIIAHTGIPNTDKSKKIQRTIPAFFSIIATSVCVMSAGIPIISKIIILITLYLTFTTYQYLSNNKNILPEFCHGTHIFSAIAIITTLNNPSILNLQNLTIISTLLFASVAINLCIRIKFGKTNKQHIIYLILATTSTLVTLIYTENIATFIIISSLIPLAYHTLYKLLSKHRLHSIAITGFSIYPIAWLATLITYQNFFSNPHISIHLATTLIPLTHLILIKYNKLPHLKAIKPILIIATATLITIFQLKYMNHWQLTLALTAMIYHLLDQKENKILTAIAATLFTISITAITTITPVASTAKPLMVNLIALIPLTTYFIRKYTPSENSTSTSTYYPSIQRTLAILASLALWIASSAHLIRFHDSSALSIVWALVGLIILSIGFLSKDITFRTMAIIILGCTLAHVFTIDVWKLNALLRIMSFITLGIVLLIVGYLYCRKPDQPTNHKP